MKTTLEHLPPHKQEQLRAITGVLTEDQQADMVILFGSHARGDWVEDPVTGYKSDYDLMVIVRSERLSDEGLWQEKLQRARAHAGATPVTLIVHDMKFVNHEIRIGQYFFSDVANEGVMLHDSRRHQLAKPKALNDVERLELGEHNFRYWYGSANEFYRGCAYYAARQLLSHGAFLLHQAAERYYHAVLLVLTGYKPQSHDIEELGRQAAAADGRLLGAIPNTEPEDQRLHKLLRRAYIDSRYSKTYRITAEELKVLRGRVRGMAEVVREVCVEKLGSFRGAGAVSLDLPMAPREGEDLLEGLPAAPREPEQFEEWKRGLIELSKVQWEAKGRDAGFRDGEAKGRDAGFRDGEVKGRNEGKLEGQREALLMVMKMRGIEVTEGDREKIQGTVDEEKLRGWMERALGARVAGEVLGD